MRHEAFSIAAQALFFHKISSNMEETVTSSCRNCEAPLPPGANFCHHCGQRNTDGRLTFREMFQEFTAAFFNLDGKIFQTLSTLAVPGKLTSEYFSGRQVPYYHPVRLFIVSGALFISLYSLSTGGEAQSLMEESWKSRLYEYQGHQEQGRLLALRDSLAGEFPAPTARAALDTLVGRFTGYRRLGQEDTLELPLELELFGSNAGPIRIAEKDLFTLAEDSLAVKYGLSDFLQRLAFVQSLRIWKSGESFFSYFTAKTLWMLLLMMPLMAVVLKVLYWRRRFLFYEHLVFSFHTHTFLFLLLSFLLTLRKAVNFDSWLLAMVGVAVYLLVSMKRFYGQAWGRTVLKFAVANVLYFVIFILALAGTFVVSAAFF
ncbi:MAG: hypothetical protein RI973_837 [Bacteroidota bacterium]